MEAESSPISVDTALALSKRAHEAVEATGLPDLAAEWRARIDGGELTERSAARLIAVGAVYPSDAVTWLAQTRADLALSSDQVVRLVVDDEELDGHGLVLTGTVAETLGRTPDAPVEAARLLVALIDAPGR